MLIIQNRQIFSDDNKYVHRIGTDTYFKRSTLLPEDTIDNFEEVDSIPLYTKAEYDNKVAELVRKRYTADEEFALQRKMLNVTIQPATFSADTSDAIVAEYAAYNEYVEQCKAEAPELLNAEKLAEAERELNDGEEPIDKESTEEPSDVAE